MRVLDYFRIARDSGTIAKGGASLMFRFPYSALGEIDLALKTFSEVDQSMKTVTAAVPPGAASRRSEDRSGYFRVSGQY